MTEFSPGAVVGRSFQLWARNFFTFSLTALAIQSPSIALAAVWGAAGGAGRGGSRAQWFLSTLLGFVATGALTAGVLNGLSGRPARLGAMLRAGADRVWAVARVSVVGQLAVLLGLVLLVVPGLALVAGLWVAIPVAVAEQWKGTSDALTRSWELTRGRRWKVLAAALVTLGISLGGAILSVLLLDVAAEWGVNAAVVSALEEATGALAFAFLAVGAAVCYHELRTVREGRAGAELAKVFE